MNRLWVLVAVQLGCTSSQRPIADDPSGGMDIESPPEMAPGQDAGVPLPADVTIVDERFDAMATGAAPSSPWSVDVRGGSIAVREAPFPTDKSVELRKPAGAELARLGVGFGTRGGRLGFDAKVLARETAGFKAIPYIRDSAGAPVVSVAFQDGQIVTRVGATLTPVQPFAANTWYQVHVVLDTTAGTFDLFIDGVRKFNDAAVRTPAATVAALDFYLDGPTDGTLLVDGVRIYDEADFIGSAPEPRFDPRDFGAAANGTTDDQLAIQRAIDAAAGTGGSVVLARGTFLSGALTLRSKMTFFIESSATLLGTTVTAAYPARAPGTGNTQLHNCRRALLYAEGVTELVIDGGGTIDGQGDAFTGREDARPMLIWTVLSDHVTVRNLYLKKGAMWSLVTMETDHVAIRNVNVQSDGITRDGIDIVDGSDIVIERVAVRSGDDAMCLKTGVRRGIDRLVVRDSMFSGSNGGSNGIKFGTATYGAFKHITIEDNYVKDVQHAAIAVESRQGADVEQVDFRRIDMANVGSAFFVYLAQQARTHPIGDVPKLGSMRAVSFREIAGTTASWGNSPHQAALITGHLYEGVVYPIRDLVFADVHLGFTGGRTSTPGAPPEAIPDQYPESNMFGDLPAWGYYLRHVDGVRFERCTSYPRAADVRPALVTDDVTGLAGTP
jgi:hypothetical protein